MRKPVSTRPQRPLRNKARNGLKPVSKAEANKISTTPGKRPTVSGSPKNKAPQLTPNRGIKKADEVAALAGMSRIRRMLIQ